MLPIQLPHLEISKTVYREINIFHVPIQGQTHEFFERKLPLATQWYRDNNLWAFTHNEQVIFRVDFPYLEGKLYYAVEPWRVVGKTKKGYKIGYFDRTIEYEGVEVDVSEADFNRWLSPEFMPIWASRYQFTMMGIHADRYGPVWFWRLSTAKGIRNELRNFA